MRDDAYSEVLVGRVSVNLDVKFAEMACKDMSQTRRKPFDIEILWFTEPLEAIGQPSGFNCETSLHDCRNSNVPVIAPVGRWTANDAAELTAFSKRGARRTCDLNV